ncbi:TMV resistance protein N-like protein, partial [Tanacetum coccineum]
ASSASCLKELVKIYELKESDHKDKYEVWPIFYDVSPSMVRNQTEAYKEAILKHEDSKISDVLTWKIALTWAGNLSGWDLQNTICGHESNFINTISKEIFYKLIDGPIHVGTNFVWIECSCRPNGLDTIWGVKKGSHDSFCEDVKSNVHRHGLVHLQTNILDDIIKDEDIKKRLSKMKRMMKGKKVMILAVLYSARI